MYIKQEKKRGTYKQGRHEWSSEEKRQPSYQRINHTPSRRVARIHQKRHAPHPATPTTVATSSVGCEVKMNLEPKPTNQPASSTALFVVAVRTAPRPVPFRHGASQVAAAAGSCSERYGMVLNTTRHKTRGAAVNGAAGLARLGRRRRRVRGRGMRRWGAGRAPRRRRRQRRCPWVPGR